MDLLLRASSVREQAAPANGLRNLLSRGLNSLLLLLLLVSRRNIGTRRFPKKFPLTLWYQVENIVIAK